MNDLELKRFNRLCQIGENGCIVWTGATRQGYGVFTVKCQDGKWRTKQAHRLSYEHYIGPISSALLPDHLCRNPPCINPVHIEPVSPKENVMRGIGITAKNAQKTHCNHGHEFSTNNTYIDKNGHRYCRPCRRETNIRFVERKSRFSK